MGFEGFSGLESILYHLQSPCRVIELRRVRADRARGVGARRACPPAPPHRGTCRAAGDAITGRELLMWNDDVEISLARPTETMDYFFRNGEGDEVIFVHEGSGTLETIFGDVPYKPGDYIVVPRGTTYRFAPVGEQRYLVFETPGLMTIPKRYRNEHGQLMEHAPYYHRDIHPPTRPADAPRPGRARRQGARARRLSDLRDRLPPVRRRRLGRLRLPVDVLDPRLRADHRPHPHAAAVAPDVRGPELRDLLVLPAQARLRPRGDPDPVSPLEPPERGDDLLRRRELLVAQGDRRRVDHAAPVGPAARTAARPGGEVARR